MPSRFTVMLNTRLIGDYVNESAAMSHAERKVVTGGTIEVLAWDGERPKVVARWRKGQRVI